MLPAIAAANGGEIPATQFLIHDVEPYRVLQAVTHMFELRLRVRGARDLPIRIMALGTCLNSISEVQATPGLAP